MNNDAFYSWCKSWQAGISSSLVMGIINVTPDSFSDGGQFLTIDSALKHAEALITAGADLLDIGGESTRPFATPVLMNEELARVIPVIEAIRERFDIALSIDTYKPEVMEAAIAAGAAVINDIMALRAPGALSTAARLNVPVCLMHMHGVPGTMQKDPQYPKPIEEIVTDFFSERIEACLNAGIARHRVMIDPGFGFGKQDEHNLRLTRALHDWVVRYKLPVWFGCSRKNTLGAILQKSINDRMPGGLGLAVYAKLQGVAVIRTHDVAETRDALKMVHAVEHAMA